MYWTTHQNDVLRAYSFRGVEAVQAALARECGVERTVRAIEMQASRIHVSLRVQTECPECGVVGERLNRQTGLCPRCSERQHLAEEIAFNERLEAERREVAESGETEELKREYDAMRQRNSRLRRKYGLTGRQKRVCDRPQQCGHEKTQADKGTSRTGDSA